ncbi:hypothetical protein ABPG77_000576 [Micractinium sp. CCAP 211/92]
MRGTSSAAAHAAAAANADPACRQQPPPAFPETVTAWAAGTGKSASLAGRVHIRLAGRSGCRERGYLGPQPCAAGPRGLALKSVGGGPFATFVLEEPHPGAGEYTIRYLGAAKPRPGGPVGCGPAAVRLYRQQDGQALIEWQLVVGTDGTGGFSLTSYTQMAAPGSPDAVAFLFTAPVAGASLPEGCPVALSSMTYMVCSESVGAVAFELSICPLDSNGNPALGSPVVSGSLDYVSRNVCDAGDVRGWTSTRGSIPLTPGGVYAFVLSSRVPTSGTPVPWRWVDSPGDAAPVPPGLPIGYKELSGGVWTAHTPNNWVQVKFN